MTASLPVAIPGLSFVRALGVREDADLLLYRQDQPSREVVVKISTAPLHEPAARERFAREASAMRALSQHPSIVTIHEAALASDGRAYLVMEYCSLPTLGARADKHPLPVPELIQTMVRLSGAVETGHRAGILHRRITPARVLTTDYGWPALTYHSMPGTTPDDEVAAEPGTIGWAAPEAVAGRGSDERSDVYSLAATAYTALSGGSPFPAADADVTKLMTRVLRDPVPRIGRDDVPASLERLLHAALAKSPAERPQTAADFGRILQSIEQELGLPVTHLDIRADEGVRREAETDAVADGDAESTFLSASRPRPAAASGATPAPPSLGSAETDEATVLTRRARPPAEAAAGSSREERPDDGATVLSRREPPPADEVTVLVRRDAAPVADETMRSPRAGAATARPRDPAERADVHPDDVTRLVARDPAPPSPGPAADAVPRTDARDVDGAEDVTRFVPGRRADRAPETRSDDEADAAAMASPPPPTRRAYSPAEAGVAGRVYGVRAAPATAPPPRAQSAASAPSLAPAVVPPPAKAPRRAVPAFVIVGIGALAVTAGAAAALIALLTG